ncbi:MAG: Mrp/NBP35 family ATP-binding protein [Candidatus Aenigmarchaeota archaeon]|nr:Mrp/NBP35 family ATP-binding protein [Candidatus Aenigmarchaeota archaeon]
MFKTCVMSGKGGVGKSTIATQLAIGLANLGYDVGLVDLDVEGPNITRMLGIMDKKLEASPIHTKPYIYSPHLKVVSVASHPCITGNNPLVWTGKSHAKYVHIIMDNVDWGHLDHMVFDFPPGTGDAVMGLWETFEADGIVLVSAPSKLSTDNCELVIKVAHKLKAPILGLVENFSCFICECNRKHYIFGESNAKALAEKYNIKFYGEIPLLTELSSAFDNGKPYVFPLIYEVIDDIVSKNKSTYSKVAEVFQMLRR